MIRGQSCQEESQALHRSESRRRSLRHILAAALQRECRISFCGWSRPHRDNIESFSIESLLEQRVQLVTQEMLKHGLAAWSATGIGHQEKGCPNREQPQQKFTLAFPHVISSCFQRPTVTSAFVGMG